MDRLVSGTFTSLGSVEPITNIALTGVAVTSSVGLAGVAV